MRWRTVLIVGVIFVCGILMGLYLSTRGPGSQVTGEVEPPSPEAAGRSPKLASPDIAAEDIELVQGSGGEVLWKLRARKAEYNQDRGVVVVDKPQLTTFLGEDRREVFVKADLGEVNQKENQLTLWDNVAGRFGMFTLRADSLDYIGAMEKVFLKGGVSVGQADLSVNATAVEIDIATRELVAAGNVRAAFTPKLAEGDAEQLLQASPIPGAGPDAQAAQENQQ